MSETKLATAAQAAAFFDNLKASALREVEAGRPVHVAVKNDLTPIQGPNGMPLDWRFDGAAFTVSFGSLAAEALGRMAAEYAELKESLANG